MTSFLPSLCEPLARIGDGCAVWTSLLLESVVTTTLVRGDQRAVTGMQACYSRGDGRTATAAACRRSISHRTRSSPEMAVPSCGVSDFPSSSLEGARAAAVQRSTGSRNDLNPHMRAQSEALLRLAASLRDQRHARAAWARAGGASDSNSRRT